MWGNSQYGERWTSLRIPCPVSGCSNTSIINQTHGSCGGQVEVSSQARVRCQRCGSASSIKHWNFSCSSRERGRADVNSLTDALTTALNVRAMDESIVMDLIINLRNNPY
jgi:hypothetical protein